MKLFSKLIGLVLIALFGICFFMIYKLNILPMKYLIPVAIILGIVVLFLVFKLFKKKVKALSRFFYILISLCATAGFVYLLVYINATYDFMNSLVFKDYEIVTYDVVVNKNSGYEKIKNLDSKNMGYLDTDKNYDKVKFLMKADIEVKDNKYKSVDNFVDDIKNNRIDSIMIEDNHFKLYKEEYENLDDTTKVIKTYKLIVKKEHSSNKDIKNPFIVYISGIDTYGKIASVSRSDVNILAVVNPVLEKVLLVSIPRDYYVELDGTNGAKDKLTHAGMYGIDTSVKTIENLLDTNIDYYVRLNFSTLTKSIDKLGGVDVYSDTSFTSYIDGSIHIQEGMNHMDGKTALAFARERHAYRTGDRHRGENQQAIITAMIEKMTDKKNITKYKDILTSLDGTFETSMSYKNISNLFKMQLDRNINWKISSVSLDGSGSYQPTYSMGQRKLYVMIPDDESVNSVKGEINKYLKTSKE